MVLPSVANNIAGHSVLDAWVNKIAAMTEPALPKHWTISNLEAAEKIAAELGISRDEGIRESSTEVLAKLKPLIGASGTVTAGNSSPISDGAAAVLLGTETAFASEPLARITGRAAHAVDPDYFTIAPIEAANKALKQAGKTWAELDFVELNEAFAAQSIACLRGWPDLDPEKLNIHGGAIAMGHPLGASGARIISHAAHQLKRRGGGVAVVAVCIAVGQGLALVLER